MSRAGRVRHRLEAPRWPSEAEARASRLFSPIHVGPVHLTSRTWVPAMVPWRAQESGEVTEALLDWYGRFAEGRPGAIVVEATGIRDIPSGPLLRIGDDRFVEGLSRLVTTVRERSGGATRLFIQLIDFLTVKRRPPADKFFRRFLRIEPRHRDRLQAIDERDWHDATDEEVRERLLADETLWPRVLSPRELEDLTYGYRERVTDMHLPHVRALPETLPPLFAAAAERAERAGFDGVELHFAHAYTMSSFLSRTNDREDGYGGSREARVRLPLEVYAATRAALSERVAVGCRFLSDEVIAGGSRVEDAMYYGARFAEAGMDFLSLSKGGKFDDAKVPRVGQAVYPYTGPSGHECMPTIYSDERGPLGRHLPLTKRIRTAVREAGLSTPVVAAGALNTFDLAEGAIAEGACDIVAAARQSLADPDWWEKMRTGQGDAVRTCALTNYCEGLDQQHKQVTCRLWDRDFSAGDDPMRSTDGKRRLVAPPWR